MNNRPVILAKYIDGTPECLKTAAFMSPSIPEGYNFPNPDFSSHLGLLLGISNVFLSMPTVNI